MGKKQEISLELGDMTKLCKMHTWIARISMSGYDRRYWYKEKTAHPSCKDMEQTDFQILSIENY